MAKAALRKNPPPQPTNRSFTIYMHTGRRRLCVSLRVFPKSRCVVDHVLITPKESKRDPSRLISFADRVPQVAQGLEVGLGIRFTRLWKWKMDFQVRRSLAQAEADVTR